MDEAEHGRPPFLILCRIIKKHVSPQAVRCSYRPQNTSREQTFEPRSKWALVPEFFAPGTRNTFSPGWRIQPGLKVLAQRLLRQTEVAGTFSPSRSHQPGLKVYFYSRLVAPTGSKGLLPGRGCARGWKVTFSPGWIHQLGLNVLPL